MLDTHQIFKRKPPNMVGIHLTVEKRPKKKVRTSTSEELVHQCNLVIIQAVSGYHNLIDSIQESIMNHFIEVKI